MRFFSRSLEIGIGSGTPGVGGNRAGLAFDQPPPRRDASRALADPQGATTVTLDIYDNLGRHLGAFATATVGQARMIMPIDLRSLPSGTYSLRATMQGQSVTTHDVVPLVIVR